MTKAGDEIVNPRTGQRMVFLETGTETGGELVRIEAYNSPTGVAEPEHVHPFHQSGAGVISGSLRFRVGCSSLPGPKEPNGKSCSPGTRQNPWFVTRSAP